MLTITLAKFHLSNFNHLSEFVKIYIFLNKSCCVILFHFLIKYIFSMYCISLLLLHNKLTQIYQLNTAQLYDVSVSWEQGSRHDDLVPEVGVKLSGCASHLGARGLLQGYSGQWHNAIH